MRVVFFILCMVLVSCGEGELFGPSREQLVVTERALQEVKLIGPSITNGKDPSTFTQNTYKVTSSKRVLLRLHTLKEVAQRIIIDDDHRAYLKIQISDKNFDINNYINDMKICPLTKNWLILATWKKALLFGTSSTWSQAGGDYNDSECLYPISEVTQTENTLTYDVSDWFEYYYLSLKKNYGWVFISDKTAIIYGDNHQTKSPRLSWNEVIPNT